MASPKTRQAFGHRTMEYLRKQGMEPWPGDRTIPAGRIPDPQSHICPECEHRWVEDGTRPINKTVDMFRFADLVALDIPNAQIVAIQYTSKTNLSARRKKILAEPHARNWLVCNGRIMLIAWAKEPKKKGGKTMIWTPKIEEWRTVDEFDNTKRPALRTVAQTSGRARFFTDACSSRTDSGTQPDESTDLFPPA